MIRKVLYSLLVGTLGVATAARGGVDTYQLGNGHSGALTVNASGTILNAYTRITSAAPVGQTFVTVASTTGFSVGDLIMIWQASGLTAADTSGAQSPQSIADKTGTWELARITSLTGTRLTFNGAPLLNRYPATGAQAVRVPEFTTATINSSGSVTAQPWDGTTGGIVVFLATGQVTNNSTISAAQCGFRGGVAGSDASATGNSALNLLPPNGGQKGEGLVPARYNTTSATGGGRGNAVHGGGGGDALLAGGGGGGNVGSGGVGGRSSASDGSRAVGGFGGTTIVYNPLARFFMGGGGGAGHSATAQTRAGGNGGGVVFIRAASLAGTGAITADGGSVPPNNVDGGCGGGGGGNICVRLTGSAGCGSLSALGGNGESVNGSSIGTGGGGGGGSVVFQSASGTCAPVAANIAGGTAGTQTLASAPDGLTYGSAPGTPGSVTILDGGMQNAVAVTLATPAASSTVGPGPRITGLATPTSAITITVDGTTTFTTTADSNGYYAYKPTYAEGLADGTHTIVVTATYQGSQASTTSRSFITSVALPVVMQSFGARVQEGTVWLEWETASEQNSDGFAVERSPDGIRFGQIDFVRATGNGSGRRYASIDATPLPGPGYYRLRLVDLNGSFRYSKTVSVNLATQTQLSISPNPAHDGVSFRLAHEPDKGAVIHVINGEGRVVRRIRLEAGKPGQSIWLSRGDLPAGVYYVEVRDGNGLHLAGSKLVIE